MNKGNRLDVTLCQRDLCVTRERAQGLIMSGVVYVNGCKEDKPGHRVSEFAKIEIRGNPVPYVSRGGLKLEKALEVFQVDVTGLSVLDVGASTGGFTDCLLQKGAKHVTAVDVGYGQLAWTLRNDERVANFERTNIRYLTREKLDSVPELTVLDVSFISLGLVLPTVRVLAQEGAPVICLVKPQFEAGREHVGKNGVVRDPNVHLSVLQGFYAVASNVGYCMAGLDFSPIRGPKGNIEFLSYLKPGLVGQSVSMEIMKAVVETAHREAGIS